MLQYSAFLFMFGFAGSSLPAFSITVLCYRPARRFCISRSEEFLSQMPKWKSYRINHVILALYCSSTSFSVISCIRFSAVF